MNRKVSHKRNLAQLDMVLKELKATPEIRKAIKVLQKMDIEATRKFVRSPLVIARKIALAESRGV